MARRLGAWRYVECTAQKYVNIDELSASLANVAWEVYKQHKAKHSAPLDLEFETTLMPENMGSSV